MPLDPDTQTIIELASAAGELDFARLDPDTFRRAFRHSLSLLHGASARVAVGRVEDRSVDGPGGAVPVRVYHPASPGVGAVVSFFHGGGWVIGDLDTHDDTCRLLCDRTGAVVVSVGYRLAPEHRFPAALDDCDAALRWVAAHGAQLAGDGARLAVAGDSAGGNLAAAVTLRACRRGSPVLAAQALVYPAVDFTTVRGSVLSHGEGYLLSAAAMRWFAAQYLGEHDPADPLASPLLADLAGLPPAIVATAEFDPLRDEGRAYADALERAGVRVERLDFPGLVHGFLGLGGLSRASALATDTVWEAFRALLVG